MAQALPQSIKSRLKLTLGQWRRWQTPEPLSCAPEVLRPLEGGISNTSILVTHQTRMFVVRLDGVDTRGHNLNRQVEWKTLLAASGHGLAPQPVYFNPELGVLVCQYLPPDENQQQSEVDIAKLVRQIHALPAVHHRIDLRQRIRQYLHQLEAQQPDISAVLSTITSQTESIIQQAESADTPLVVCHNDLLSANRLRSNGRLYAVDWEYSGMGHRWFDLAVICEGGNDASINADSLLDAYLERSASLLERDTLLRFRLCYRYLAWLWYAVCDQRPISENALAAFNDGLAPALAEAVTGKQR